MRIWAQGATVYSAGLLALAGCTYPQEPARQTDADTALPSLAADKSQPLLALMDHMLHGYFASDVARRPTVCVAMHDGRSEVALPEEAELALMMRYEALAPFARCGWIDNAWQDTETSEPAMVFNIHSFTCADDANCSGFGGYIAGQTSSLSSMYTMKYESGAWNFTRDQRLVGQE